VTDVWEESEGSWASRSQENFASERFPTIFSTALLLVDPEPGGARASVTCLKRVPESLSGAVVQLRENQEWSTHLGVPRNGRYLRLAGGAREHLLPPWIDRRCLVRLT